MTQIAENIVFVFECDDEIGRFFAIDFEKSRSNLVTDLKR